MNSITGLTKLLTAIKEDFEFQKENNETWNALIALLESYNSTPESNIFADEKAKNFFFSEFTEEIAKRIANLTKVQTDHVLFIVILSSKLYLKK